MKHVLRFLALVLFIMLVGVSILSVRYASIDQTPPVTKFRHVETLNSPLFPGEPVLLRIWRDKVRDDCPVTSDRRAIGPNGTLIEMPSAKWAGGSPNNDYVDVLYPTPHDIPAGGYLLRVDLSYQCPGLPPFSYDQPDGRFVIRSPIP